MRKTKERKCLVTGCKSKAAFRGLCRNHYASAIRQVRQGKTTWAALEKRGLAIPVRVSPIIAAVREAAAKV